MRGPGDTEERDESLPSRSSRLAQRANKWAGHFSTMWWVPSRGTHGTGVSDGQSLPRKRNLSRDLKKGRQAGKERSKVNTQHT